MIKNLLKDSLIIIFQYYWKLLYLKKEKIYAIIILFAYICHPFIYEIIDNFYLTKRKDIIS